MYSLIAVFPVKAGEKPGLRIVPAIMDALVVEPRAVSFGRMNVGEGREIHGAIAVRVNSDRPWVLRVMPGGSVTVTGTGTTIPLSRLQIRRSGEQRFVPVVSATELVRGVRTGESGELIVLDLRLEFGADDRPGDFEAILDLMLEPV